MSIKIFAYQFEDRFKNDEAERAEGAGWSSVEIIEILEAGWVGTLVRLQELCACGSVRWYPHLGIAKWVALALLILGCVYMWCIEFALPTRGDRELFSYFFFFVFLVVTTGIAHFGKALTQSLASDQPLRL